MSEEEEELALRCSVLCENSSPEPGRLSCEPADDICLFQTTDVGVGQAIVVVAAFVFVIVGAGFAVVIVVLAVVACCCCCCYCV